MVTRASFTWSSSSNPANAQELRDRCGKDGGLLRSGSRSGFGYHDHSTPNPNQSCYPDGYSTDTGKGRELETEPLTWDWRDGLWRSLVSALDWGFFTDGTCVYVRSRIFPGRIVFYRKREH
jgi:hypothetical protein